ncbi:MAG: hypothetical protein PVJ76_02505 [Gemmatimonadota bacterium]|jgi:hypothetical protein
MKVRQVLLTLVAPVIVGLVACQDSGVVAPDEAISPDNPAALFGKPQCPEGSTLPWPKCNEDDGGDDPDSNTGTVWLQLTAGGGLVGGPEEGRSIQVNNRNKLDMAGPSAVYSALILTHPTFDLDDGPCRVAPGGASDAALLALAGAMWMASGGPGSTPAPEDFINTRILINKKKLGQESPDHFISIGYDTGDPDLGWIWLGIGNEVLGGELGYTTVSGPEEVSEGPDTYQKYVFSGGPVRMSPTAYPVSETPFIACPLLDEVTVLIKFP